MTTRRIVLLCMTFILLVAAAPFVDAIWWKSIQIDQDDFATYRLPLKAHPDNPALPLYAYSEMIDWDRFGQIDVPGLASLVYGEYAGGGSSRYVEVVTVSKGRAPTQLGGATCTATNSTNANGSALASFSDSSITKPYVVYVLPGVYPECWSIDNRTDISIAGIDTFNTIFRPPVSANGDVVGGVGRVAGVTTTAGSTQRISLSGFTAQNDDWGPHTGTLFVEPAIMIGRKSVTGSAGSPWRDVFIHGVRGIGNDTALAIIGSRLSTDKNVPRLLVRDSTFIGGSRGVGQYASFTNTTMQGIEARVYTNYCESTDSTLLATITGTAVGGTSDVQLDAATTPTTEKSLVGRMLQPTGNCTGGYQSGMITAFDAATDTVHTHGAASASWAGCTYRIQAVANAGVSGMGSPSFNPPCTDIDWTIFRDPGSLMDGTGGMAGQAGIFLHGSGTTAPDGAHFEVMDSQIFVDIADGGGLAIDSAVGAPTSNTNGRADGVSGININRGAFGEAHFDNVSISANLLVDIHDKQPAGFSGVTIADMDDTDKATYAGRITLNNTKDPDIEMNCFQIGGANVGANIDLSGAYCDTPSTGLPTRDIGTAAATTANTITLAGTASVVNDFYNDTYVSIMDGACAGDKRRVWDYTGGTKVANITPDFSAACGTPTYQIGYTGDAFALPSLRASLIKLSGSAAITVNELHGSGVQDYAAGAYYGVYGVINVPGTLTSDVLIRTTGDQITGWNEKCALVPDFTLALTQNQSVPIVDSNVGIQVAYVACACKGTCAAGEQIDFKDGADASMSGTVNCTDNNTALSWTDVRADAQSTLAVGTSPMIDTVTASGVGTDDIQVCFRYTTTRW